MLIPYCGDNIPIIAASDSLVDPENPIAASAVISENEAWRLASWTTNILTTYLFKLRLRVARLVTQ